MTTPATTTTSAESASSTAAPVKYLAVLGRQPELSLAELTYHFNTEVKQLSEEVAAFETSAPVDINRLGSIKKIARLLPGSPLDYLKNLPAGKITLGFSDYSPRANKFSAKNEAMKLKKILARLGRSVRILDNKAASLSTATSHHNQLGEKVNHVEILKFGKESYLLVGVQNITAYARRDQARPARDARVGMLPPKLAQILLNLATDRDGNPLPESATVLDPFCGTGVVLQEAALMGYHVYGTDLEDRMVEYTEKNLKWLGVEDLILEQGDATTHQWTEDIDAVVCETYLGPPMSKIPPEIKLKDAKHVCSEIIVGFLKNLAPQLPSGTPVVLAVPAWKRPAPLYTTSDNATITRPHEGSTSVARRETSYDAYEGLNLLDKINQEEYNLEKHKKLGNVGRLLYYREDQIVAREIIVLRKK